MLEKLKRFRLVSSSSKLCLIHVPENQMQEGMHVRARTSLDDDNEYNFILYNIK